MSKKYFFFLHRSIKDVLQVWNICVCVRVCTHTRTHIHTYTYVKHGDGRVHDLYMCITHIDLNLMETGFLILAKSLLTIWHLGNEVSFAQQQLILWVNYILPVAAE